METIRRIDEAGLQVALVADDAHRLLGVVTDGDIRRAILRGVELQAPTSTIMNPKPHTLPQHKPRREILAYMRRYSLRQVPVVNVDGKLVGLELLDALIGAAELPNAVVLMAGGLGTRLRPLTETCPKPLLSVGGKPILERILGAFIEEGFRHFYFAVNYKAEMIIEHFGDGGRWGVQIEYLRETRRLGTAGALSLLPIWPEHPFFVMNGDLLTQANFSRMLEFHEQYGGLATMAVREYDIRIPYGVVRLDGDKILSIKEKPLHSFFVNAGIYVLEPEAVAHIPANDYCDMPSLFKRLNGAGSTAAYPLREYWLDIGRQEELERAHSEWTNLEET
ncbi:putative mannose-1-phosphate guanyltransferase [Nitrococcus mobilis Nb-231]|uniref:Putative mannose-1-phosphate guanyltransferase n=1 Tax=Nitrococcus mobilis Nb-231 TaxID=314278 RepID=A4BMG5_9GAMM|nr:putative mannose-1-phosphate guanyltransferase [Nitrococcus mobilis Nb-231]